MSDVKRYLATVDETGRQLPCVLESDYLDAQAKLRDVERERDQWKYLAELSKEAHLKAEAQLARMSAPVSDEDEQRYNADRMAGLDWKNAVNALLASRAEAPKEPA